jgi:hypothetical protein
MSGVPELVRFHSNCSIREGFHTTLPRPLGELLLLVSSNWGVASLALSAVGTPAEVFSST